MAIHRQHAHNETARPEPPGEAAPVTATTPRPEPPGPIQGNPSPACEPTQGGGCFLIYQRKGG